MPAGHFLETLQEIILARLLAISILEKKIFEEFDIFLDFSKQLSWDVPLPIGNVECQDSVDDALVDLGQCRVPGQVVFQVQYNVR